MSDLDKIKVASVRNQLTGFPLVKWAQKQISEADSASSIREIIIELSKLAPDDDRGAVDLISAYINKEAPGFIPGSDEWIRIAQKVIYQECVGFLDGKSPIDRLCKAVISAEDLCTMAKWLGPLPEACGTFIFAYYHLGNVMMEIEEIEAAVAEAAQAYVQRFEKVTGLYRKRIKLNRSPESSRLPEHSPGKILFRPGRSRA